MTTIKLNDTLSLPALGLGTWQLTGETCRQAVKLALKMGYRHIDTAERYGNHLEIAQGIKDSGIARPDFYLTSKIWMDHFTADQVRPTFEQALRELETEYLDLYLMHYPDRSIPYAETLKELQKLKAEGLIKAIGVSNFTIRHLEEALSVGVEIVTNQVEFHPTLTQPDLKKFCDNHGIVLTAYSPLAQGQDLRLPTIQEIAAAHQSTPAQVILAWLRQRDIIAIPKASDEKHLADNFASQKLILEDEEIERINALNTNNRLIIADWSEFGY